jgi:hypothetical protein
VYSRALAAEPASEREVLRLNGNTLRVDSRKVGVLEERDEVRLGSLLKGHDGGRLEAKVRLHRSLADSVDGNTLRPHLEVLRDLAHKALEGKLADEQLRRLLVATNLAERDCARAEAMGLLNTTGRGCLNQAQA